MSSKLQVCFVFFLLSGCQSYSTAPLASSSDTSGNASGAKAVSSLEVASVQPRVSIVAAQSFNTLTPGFILDPKLREGLTLFSEDLLNEGKDVAQVTFQVKSDAVQVQTRIHEDATYRFWSNPSEVIRTRVSTADFRLDQVRLTRSEGLAISFPVQGSFELKPGEKIHLEWIAHVNPGVVLCPFWEHQKYSDVGIFAQQTGILNWAMIGSSLKSGIVRSLQATNSGQGPALDLVDDEDSASLNQVSGDGVPNASDYKFGCDGLMELLPSSP